MKRYTVEVNHKVVKECDYANEADHHFHIERRKRSGNGETIFVYDNRDHKYVRTDKC